MANKFNVHIAGGSGSIIMGDNTKVDIRTARGPQDLGRQTNVKIQPGYGKDPFARSSFHAQETSNSEDKTVHKITQGYALIIHNKYFPKRADPDRHGSENDVTAIKEFCSNAGITINDTDRKTENLTATQMDELCNEISKRDFSRYDGFVCFILSHGNDAGIYGTDDNTISVQDIVSKFKDNPGLAGKPKLFIIQACRGTNKDSGIDSDSQPVQEKTPLRMPTESDVLVAYSSVDGYESYRSPQVGSWFITTLMKCLHDFAHYAHLMDILTIVNKRIAEYETPSGLKQMSCQLSTLTKFVYFKYPAPLES